MDRRKTGRTKAHGGGGGGGGGASEEQLLGSFHSFLEMTPPPPSPSAASCGRNQALTKTNDGRRGGLDTQSISTLSYRPQCPPPIYLSAGGGRLMAVTLPLMNLFVCRNKHAHAPDNPQLLTAANR